MDVMTLIRYFNNPFLPIRMAKTVILDGRVSIEIKNSFQKMGIEYILTSKNSNVYDAVAYHPDILLHPVTKNKIVVNTETNTEMLEILKFKGFEIIQGETQLECNYPGNIAYNVARVGNYAFHNLRYTDRILRQELENAGVQFVNVRQGYAKCSTAIVSRNAIITSDNGIAKAAEKNDIDVLLIEPGNIVLPGLNYGFIGGAAGLVSEDTMAFTGHFSDSKIFEKINDFLAKHSVKALFLSNEEICDIGSIITIE